MDGMNPHIMCIRKHHMKEQDLLHLTLPGYALRHAADAYRGGVCMYFHKQRSIFQQNLYFASL